MAFRRQIDTVIAMTFKRLSLAVPALIVAAIGALASAAATHAEAAAPDNTTILTLSVAGTASHAPDTTVATMSIQNTAPTAAGAQAAVNAAMASALAAAKTIQALQATTGSYDVFPADTKQSAWRAQQSLTLRLAAPPNSALASKFRHMIGELQARGMTLDQIGGTLSSAAARVTRTAAIKDAVTQMRAEADATAAALSDRVAAITKVDLTTESPFRPMMMAARVATAPAPQLQSGTMTEQITLSAIVTLQPLPHQGSLAPDRPGRDRPPQ
jgi:uncharacterized protein YggE